MKMVRQKRMYFIGTVLNFKNKEKDHDNPVWLNGVKSKA